MNLRHLLHICLNRIELKNTGMTTCIVPKTRYIDDEWLQLYQRTKESCMWRSLFLAAGIVLCILGGECLIMEKAVLAKSEPEPEQNASFFSEPISPTNEFKPPDWAPWTLLSVGAVVIIYSYSIPRHNAG